MGTLKEYGASIKRSFKLKNYLGYFVIIILTVILAILTSGKSITRSNLALLERIGYSVIMAMSLSLVVGFLGELSLGHAAFMSIGAYIGCYVQNILLSSLTETSPVLSVLVALLIGGAVAGIFGFLIGLPALRLKGDYLAIVTLAFGEIVKVIFQNIEKPFGGVLGMTNKYRFDIYTFFIIIFIVVLIVLAIIQNLIRSKHGRAVMAIRDNEVAARAMGVNVSYYKIMAFVLSAVIAGFAGVLYANTQNRIFSTTFDYNYSIDILVMVVLGGMGNINGSMIAATLITFIDVKLATVLTGDMAVVKDMVYALILILLVIYNNAPKLKAVREKLNVRKLFDKVREFIYKVFKSNKSAVDPSNEVEFGADWSRVPTKVEMDAILSTDLTPDNTYTPDKPDKPTGGKN